MARVITFSRVFPADHPRKGEPTNFVEQFLYCLISNNINNSGTELLKNPIVDIKAFTPNRMKYHTIRAGKRWKQGDMFSPRVWSGKPYHSKQIIIAPNLEVKKTLDFEINEKGEVYIDNGKNPFFIARNGNVDILGKWNLSCIARNDGLDSDDFISWFKFHDRKPFSGQIISWFDQVSY